MSESLRTNKTILLTNGNASVVFSSVFSNVVAKNWANLSRVAPTQLTFQCINEDKLCNRRVVRQDLPVAFIHIAAQPTTRTTMLLRFLFRGKATRKGAAKNITSIRNRLHRQEAPERTSSTMRNLLRSQTRSHLLRPVASRSPT